MPDLYERGCGEQEDGYYHQHTKRCFVKVDEPLYRLDEEKLEFENWYPGGEGDAVSVIEDAKRIKILERVNGADNA